MVESRAQDCDSCNNPMPDKEFEKQLACGCDICGPWVVCMSCHTQIKQSKEKRCSTVP